MYERMLHKEEKPTVQELYEYCGNMGEKFQEINAFLEENFHTVPELRFPYGKSYGWCITHRKGKKLLCDIFAEVDAFTIMLRLTNEQYERVYDNVQPYTKELIDHKYPCSDGGWIHFRVLGEEHLKDALRLLSEKCKSNK